MALSFLWQQIFRSAVFSKQIESHWRDRLASRGGHFCCLFHATSRDVLTQTINSPKGRLSKAWHLFSWGPDLVITRGAPIIESTSPGCWCINAGCFGSAERKSSTLASVQSWTCRRSDSAPFDELKKIWFFSYLFSLFLHDSLSNHRSSCDNKYCYGWNFSQEIIIIITADCLLCFPTFYSGEDKNTHSQSQTFGCSSSSDLCVSVTLNGEQKHINIYKLTFQ